MIRALPLLTLLICAAAAADAPPPPLVRNDPFSHRSLTEAGARSADASGDAGSARLKGVLTMGARHLANIDGHIVAPGEEIYGYRVLTITDRAVTLGRGDDELTMNLEDDELANGDSD